MPRNAEVFGVTSVTGANSLNEFRFQRAFSKYEVSPAFSHGSYPAGDFSAERLALCDQQIYRPDLRTGSCNDQMGPETRWQFKDDFTWFTQGPGGDHQVKFGVDYNWIDFEADSTGRYNGRFTFDTNEPFDPNNPETFPIQYRQRQPVYDRVPVHHFSIYTQDDLTSDRLTVNLGLRYDLQVGTFNEDIQDIQFPLPIPFHDGADARGDGNNWGPRVGFVYDLSGDNTGRTTVKGGYGKFFENIRTLTNFGERWWHQAQEIIINNPDFLDPLGGRSREEFVSTAPPNITVLDNNYEQPYAHHFNLGLAHQLRDDMALSLDLTRVATRADALRNVNINYPVNGMRPWPQFNRVNASYSLLDHDYQAFYAKFEKRYADGWQFLVSYTLAKSDYDGALDARHGGVVQLGVRLPRLHEGHASGRHRPAPPAGEQRDHRAAVRYPAVHHHGLPLPASGARDFGNEPERRWVLGRPGAGLQRVEHLRLPQPGSSGSRTPTVQDQGRAPVSDFACSNFLNFDFRASKNFYLSGTHGIELVFQVLNAFDRPQLRELQRQPPRVRFRRQRGLPGVEHQRPLPPVRTGPPATPLLAHGNLRASGFGDNEGSLASNINAPSRQIELALRYSF